MTNPIAPVSKLDAVNRMLASIGESPINTLVAPVPKDVAKAELALDHVTRDIQATGWSFNSDTDYPLTPGVDGRIDIPANAVFADPVDGSNYTMRWDAGGATAGLRLYDNDKRSFNEFERTVDCNLIWLYEFNQLPQHARHYIAMRAGREFQATLIGSQILYSFTREMEADAWAAFRRIEKRQKQYNINRIPSSRYVRRYNRMR